MVLARYLRDRTDGLLHRFQPPGRGKAVKKVLRALTTGANQRPRYLFISCLELAQKKKTRETAWGQHLKTKGFPREASARTSAPSSLTASRGRCLPSS